MLSRSQGGALSLQRILRGEVGRGNGLQKLVNNGNTLRDLGLRQCPAGIGSGEILVSIGHVEGQISSGRRVWRRSELILASPQKGDQLGQNGIGQLAALG